MIVWYQALTAASTLNSNDQGSGNFMEEGKADCKNQRNKMSVVSTSENVREAAARKSQQYGSQNKT